MKALISRKQLLIAESELNRVELLREWRTLADGAGRLADRAVSFKTVATSMILLPAAS